MLRFGLLRTVKTALSFKRNSSLSHTNSDGGFSKSLWAATAIEPPKCDPLMVDTSTDVCIVGGGLTGLSTAIHLAEKGVQVTVLECRDIGWGASGRTGGQVIAGLKLDPVELEEKYGPEVGPRLVQLIGSTPSVVFDLIKRHNINCHAINTGWIQPACDPVGEEIVRRRQEEWAARGVKCELLDKSQTNELLGTDTYSLSWIDYRGGSIQPLSYVRGMARAAQRLGVKIHNYTAAVSVTRSGTKNIVDFTRGKITADSVVLCTNAYTDQVHDHLRRSIVPVQALQVATKPLPAEIAKTILPQGHVSSDTRRILYFFRKDHMGRLLVGGRGTSWDREPHLEYSDLRNMAMSIFPQIGKNPEWEFQWGGLVAATIDDIPHLHQLGPGLYSALGFNGRGIAMGTTMGTLLARLVLGERHEDIPYPITAVTPLPLHSLRAPVIAAVAAWMGFRDWIGMPDSKQKRSQA